MERSDMEGREAIARRGQPDGWIKSTIYRPELQTYISQGGILPNLIIFPFRQRFLATGLYLIQSCLGLHRALRCPWIALHVLALQDEDDGSWVYPRE
jgi:hypothetical protein